MDQSKVKAIVEGASPELIRFMALEQWTIIYDYNLTDKNVYANCDAKLEYRRADISFNPSMMENDNDVITTLRHELFHVVISPFNHYLEVVDEVLTDDSNEAKMLGCVWTNVIENTVVNLELMWERLRNEPRS